MELKEALISQGTLLEDATGEDSNDVDEKMHAKRRLASKPFSLMYDEIRASVDLCHRDGTLKRAVAEDPGKYIHADDALVPMLRALKSFGQESFPPHQLARGTSPT